MFRIRQFATLANVTVRTLHHYDRLGLLRPKLRSEAGYRLYGREDLGRLERILVLRYLGLPLREIGDLLAAGGAGLSEPLAETLARQSAVLRERRDGIDRVLRAVEHAQRQAQMQAEPDWLLCQSILKELQMQEQSKWIEKYYSPEARAAIDERRALWSPEMQAKVTAQWQQMYADVQAALDRGVSPESDEGRALAGRWMELVRGFTGGNEEVFKGLGRLYADRESWPAEMQKPEVQANVPRAEHMRFIQAATKTA